MLWSSVLHSTEDHSGLLHALRVADTHPNVPAPNSERSLYFAAIRKSATALGCRKCVATLELAEYRGMNGTTGENGRASCWPRMVVIAAATSVCA